MEIEQRQNSIPCLNPVCLFVNAHGGVSKKKVVRFNILKNDHESKPGLTKYT